MLVFSKILKNQMILNDSEKKKLEKISLSWTDFPKQNGTFAMFSLYFGMKNKNNWEVRFSNAKEIQEIFFIFQKFYRIKILLLS